MAPTLTHSKAGDDLRTKSSQPETNGMLVNQESMRLFTLLHLSLERQPTPKRLLMYASRPSIMFLYDFDLDRSL